MESGPNVLLENVELILGAVVHNLLSKENRAPRVQGELFLDYGHVDKLDVHDSYDLFLHLLDLR